MLGETECFSPKIEQGTILFSPVLINIVLEVLSSNWRQEKEVKRIYIGEQEIKPTLFIDGMIVHTEKSQEIYKNTPKTKELSFAGSLDTRSTYKNQLHF